MTIADVPKASLSPAQLWRGPLPGFVLLYGALYGAYGSQSPFFPAFLGSRHLSAGEIGVALGAGAAAKLVGAPLAGRLADRFGAGPVVLAACAGATAVLGLAFQLTSGVWAVGLLLLAWSFVSAALAPLADTLALAASDDGRGFPYGWVRGLGSGAFVGGTLLAGPLVDRVGLWVILWISGALFGLTALFAMWVGGPRKPPGTQEDQGSLAGFSTLLRMPPYRTILIIAALVMGSHAMSDSFAVIRWRETGISGALTSVLWSVSVLAEVGVFFVVGPLLLARMAPAGCAALSAAAGVLRWSVMAVTAAVPAMLAVQALHGLTFALLHLTAMQVIGRTVPKELAATAQALYGAGAIGLATVALTFASGPLYARFGGAAFFAMAALCALALPVTLGLRAAPEDPAQS